MAAAGKTRIHRVEATDERLTGRGGLIFFVRYLDDIGIFPILNEYFGYIRKNKKGLPVTELFKQIFCWFLDGTSRHISFFDHLRKDEGYAASIETLPEKAASSHSVKRFCKSFSIFRIWLFREILIRLFIWRLRITQPEVIFIDIDTMVMDNNEADVRHGVGPTYKKKKGFQPLQVTWDRFVIDAVFRGGTRHSNYKDTVIKTITHLTERIRRDYRSDALIVLTCDAAFSDQKNFNAFEEPGIFYISGTRPTEDMRNTAGAQFHEESGLLQKEKQTWEYTEFCFRYGTWNKFRRSVYCRPLYEDRQMLLNFSRSETYLVTNISSGTVSEEMPAALRSLISPDGLISAYHSRGGNGLIHRALKDSGSEEMPFKRFPPNAALYYMMLTAFFLSETFKEDVLHPVIPLQSYAATVRRRFIDTAAKVVSHAGQTVLKFSSAVFRRLRLDEIWTARSPPMIPV